MANSPPSIKDNPFKRLDALRNKVSGVKAPAPAAAAPPVPARRPSDASTAPAPAVQARPRAGVRDPGGARDDRGRRADDDRARNEEGLHVQFPPVADGRAEAEDLQAAEEALST